MYFHDLSRQWPVAIAIALLLFTVGLQVYMGVSVNDGHFVYPQDDPYIHMAIAKSHALFGVWGITRHEFSSSSSSPLWTGLLSLIYRVFGVNDHAPFVLSFSFAVVSILLFQRFLRGLRAGLSKVSEFLVILIFVFITPLTVLSAIGQEHSLHLVFTLLFTVLSARLLAKDQSQGDNRSVILALVMIPVLILVRFESVFLSGMFLCLCIIAKRRMLAFLVASVIAAPVIAYGIFSVSNGGFWLPNPVLLKGNIPSLGDVKSILFLFGARFLRAPSLLALVALSIGLTLIHYRRERSMWTSWQLMLLMFLGASILHMQFALTGSLHRYDAYLVALGVFVTSVSFLKLRDDASTVRFIRRFASMSWKERAASVVGTTLLAVSMGPRLMDGLTIVPQAAGNVYRQQFQMARFLREFYPGSSVAANDIGVINFLADIKCVDLIGLGTQEVARKRIEEEYDVHQIEEITRARGVEIALVYDSWFASERFGIITRGREPGLPSKWVKVGSWQLSNRVGLGDSVVAMYSVDREGASHLARSLDAFSASMPNGVLYSAVVIR